jgi:uncharacterized RDD family membrane protein YckC
MIYDAMIVVAIWLLTGLAGAVLLPRPMLQSVLFIEHFGFFAYFWVSRGQTVGMLAWDLRIETDTGGALRPAQALLRFVGALLSFATLGVGYLWMYIDPDRRTWPDMLSKSRVIHLPRG